MAAPVLSMRGVVKEYRRDAETVRAVDGVDLDVEAGTLLAIVGPSGSGKSTLLHLMGGLDRPTAGLVRFEGRDLGSLSDRETTLLRRHRLGFVFQFFNLLPGLSVWQNIALPLLVDGAAPEPARTAAAALAERLGILHRLDAPAGRLSGGEMQRTAIARALAGGPAVVLADEPTGNLDSRTGQEVLRVLREIVDADGVTVVLVTHDAAVAGGADRRVSIADGRIAGDCASPRYAAG